MSYKKEYDLIFSIGAACSCTQVLRKCRLQFASYPFDWVVGCNLINRCKMFTNNMEKFIDKEDLTFSHKVEITQCNAFKNKFNDILFNHDFKINETLEEGYERVRTKYERRANRLYSQIDKAKNVLVVYLQLPNTKEVLQNDELKIAHKILTEKFGDKFTFLYLHITSGIKLEDRITDKISHDIYKVTFDYDSSTKDVDYAVNFKLLRKYFSIYKISNKFMDKKNFTRRLIYKIKSFKTKIEQLNIENKIKKDNSKFYKNIISLGYNCEIQFRFYNKFKYEETSLFNWSYINSIKDLIQVLNDLSLIGKQGFRVSAPLYTCNETNISFHGKAKWKKIKDNPELIEKDIKDLGERLDYLKEKFVNTLKSNEKKLYIYKVKETDITNDINEKIIELKNALKTIEGKASSEFNLLIVAEEKYANYFKNTDEYIFRTVKYFAPDKEVTSKKYLDNGWDDIFNEFYSKKPKGYKKKKKYKFE